MVNGRARRIGATVLATAVLVVGAALVAACTSPGGLDAAFLMPADPSVSFALHGSRVLAPSELAADSVVFPTANGEFPRLPVAVAATNGDIVAVASIRMGSIADNASSMLRAAVSSDGGSTWQQHPISTQVNGVEPGPVGVVDPATGQIQVLGAHRYTSDDDGRTWTSRPLVVRPNEAGVVGELNSPAAGIALRTGPHAGRLVVMCRVALPDSVRSPIPLPLQWLDWSDTTNCVLYSDDHGETWQTSQTVQTHVGEGGVVELADGSLYMSSRTYSFDGRRSEAFSYDGGATWTDFARSVLPEPYFGVNGSLAFVDDGSADGVVVYANDPEWNALFENIGATRKELSLYLSTDGAHTWRFGAVLRHGPAAYSSLVTLGHDVGVLYEAVVSGVNSTRGPSDPPDGIRFARVALSDLAHP